MNNHSYYSLRYGTLEVTAVLDLALEHGFRTEQMLPFRLPMQQFQGNLVSFFLIHDSAIPFGIRARIETDGF